MTELSGRGVRFRSLGDDAINTTTASGELIFHIFAALAQFERSLIQERKRAGLAAARARGRSGGLKPIAPTCPKLVMAKTMHKDRGSAERRPPEPARLVVSQIPDNPSPLAG